MNAIPQLHVAGSHREVGLAIGRRSGELIHRLFDNYGFLQDQLLPFHRSPAGRDHYHAFLELHRRRFPDYVAELEGMAEGAERPFVELFLVNLRGEYRGLMALESAAEGCTDCMVLTSDAALVGHNEDGTPAALSYMFVLRAQVGDQPGFTALCYPGFLAGNALGFNAAGVLHTADAVSPRQVRVGLGRHFLARSLLDAFSLSDAIKRVTVPGRGAGFTYNIGTIAERRLVNVEVSPDRHHVHEVRGHFVHTNHYLNLSSVDQTIGQSSKARMERARTLCRAMQSPGVPEVLSVLGDEADERYPIYRTATPPDGAATLCTALFDLDKRQLRVYSDHPVREPKCHIVLDLRREGP